MKSHHLIFLPLITLLTALSLSSHAEIYTWVDADGKKHFSDRPFPKGTAESDVKTITPKSHNNVEVVSLKDSQWQKDYNASKEKKSEIAAEKSAKKEQNKAKCAHIRNRLSIHNQQGRLYKVNDKGERDYQTSAQIDSDRKQLKKDLKKFCR